MLLRDFTLGSSPKFVSHELHERLLRVVHISEAITYEISRKPETRAPFGKIYVNLRPPSEVSERRVSVALSVAMVEVPIEPALLDLPTDRFRQVALDAAAEAVKLLERELGWSWPRFWELLPELREREPLFRVHLGFSRNVPRARRRIDVYYEMDEASARLFAIVRDREGNALREETIVEKDRPIPLEYVIPIKKARVLDERLVFFDAEGNELAHVQA